MKIIYYHEVVDSGKGFSYQKIEAEKFEQQMKWISENGYITSFFSELDCDNPKSLIVSFDDGYRSVYEKAFPIMKKYGIKGNVYLPTAYIGTNDQFMDWDMVADLYRSGLFEFQAHTHRHIDIRAVDFETLREEITVSNGMIAERVGYTPVAFCMPYGKYHKKSIQNLFQIYGYQYVLGSFYGEIRGNREKVLPRIGISNDDDMTLFIDKMKGKLNWKGKLQRLRLFAENCRRKTNTEPFLDQIQQYE